MLTKNEIEAWLHGSHVRCESPRALRVDPFRLILLGAPGVGKGTQAALLTKRLGACHLSTGEIFRSARDLNPSDRSPALSAALEFMHRGELVPDATALEVVAERVNCLRCKSGFLLDGFPRTVMQAGGLELLLRNNRLKLDAVLKYELPIEHLVARLAGRRNCPTCKAVYHAETRPPRIPGVCDNCGSTLIQRDDDRPESIRVRMVNYERKTAPVEVYYRRRGLLFNVLAEGTPEEILEHSLTILQNAKRVADVKVSPREAHTARH